MLLKLYEWMQDKPLIVSFILSSSCILFSFLLVFVGDKIPKPFTLTYYDDEGHIRLKLIGYIVAIGCMLWTFLLQASEKYYHYIKEADVCNAASKNYIMGRVDTGIVNVCNSKYNTLIELIADILSGEKRARYIISKPCEQLKSIIRELSSGLRYLLMHTGYTLDENDVYVSIYYKFHTQNEWKQTNSSYPETGLPLVEVVNNQNSTFACTLKDRNGMIFYNNKQEGYNKGQYIPDNDDKYDKDDKLKGSILCYKIRCQKDGIDYITAILSISTYNKRLEPSELPEKVNNFEENIQKYILAAFEKRIKIELCLLYLAELYAESRNKKKLVKVSKMQSINVKDASKT